MSHWPSPLEGRGPQNYTRKLTGPALPGASEEGLHVSPGTAPGGKTRASASSEAPSSLDGSGRNAGPGLGPDSHWCLARVQQGPPVLKGESPGAGGAGGG